MNKTIARIIIRPFRSLIAEAVACDLAEVARNAAELQRRADLSMVAAAQEGLDNVVQQQGYEDDEDRRAYALLEHVADAIAGTSIVFEVNGREVKA